MNTAQQDPFPQRPVLARQGTSLYHQMADHLRHLISSGYWKIGDRLPSMNVLAADSGLARVTIRQAVKLLESEGILEPRQGRGTFVRRIPPDPPWLCMQAKWENMFPTVEDHTITVLCSEIRPECPYCGIYTNVRQASAYRYQYRLHKRGDVPFGVNHMYLDESIYRRKPDLLDTKPVVLELQALSPSPLATAKQTLTIHQADEEIAALLGISSGAPVARVRRSIIDIHDTIVYACEIHYKGDVVKLDMTEDL